MGPAHDFVVMHHTNIERIAKGQDPIDHARIKRKLVAYISSAGAASSTGFPLACDHADLRLSAAHESSRSAGHLRCLWLTGRAQMLPNGLPCLGGHVAAAIGRDPDCGLAGRARRLPFATAIT